jgi:hypothetical protein
MRRADTPVDKSLGKQAGLWYTLSCIVLTHAPVQYACLDNSFDKGLQTSTPAHLTVVPVK